MYIPRFKLTAPLYTAGGELIDAQTQEEYVGYYVTTSKGVIYSGQFFDKNQSRELLRFAELVTSDSNKYLREVYDIAKNNQDPDIKLKDTLAPPLYLYVEDYQTPTNKRFFAKSKVDNSIKEINQETYTELANQTSKYHYPTYDIAVLEWDVTAPVEDTRIGSYIVEGSASKNRKAVSKLDQTFYGIREYLRL